MIYMHDLPAAHACTVHAGTRLCCLVHQQGRPVAPFISLPMKAFLGTLDKLHILQKLCGIDSCGIYS